MGWGGVIASGLAGAAAGVGHAVYEDALEQEKIKAQKERDAYLSQLRINESVQTHKQNTATDIANIGPAAAAKSAAALANLPASTKVIEEEEAAKARGKLTEGFTLSKGQTRFDAQGNEIAHVAPDAKVLTPEEQDLISARIQDMKDRADDRKERNQILREGVEAKKEAAGAKVGKADMANFKDVKGEGGTPTGVQVDDNTGISRKWVEGTPAVPEKKGILGFGASPGKPETKGGFVYFDQNMNQMTPDDVNKAYPKLNRVEPGPAQAPDSTAPSIKAPSGRPSGAGQASGSIGSGSPKGLPAGSRPIGKSKDGRTVYQSPDGQNWVE